VAEDTQQLARLLLETMPTMMRAMGSHARRGRHSLDPGHMRILWHLARQSCNLSELASLHGVSLPSMSATVQTLVDRDWLERSRSESDRRVVTVQPTEKGRRVLAVERRRLLAWLQIHLDQLSPAERVQLAGGLGALRRVFAQSEAPFKPGPIA